MKYLIVGLGNIGAEYTHTRHNIGFKIIDKIAKDQDVQLEVERLAFYGQFKLKGKPVHLIKPTTYMNNSGKAVKFWLNELKVDINNTMIVYDDVALPFGSMRLREKGSDGGHNGIKSLIAHLGTNVFPRLRFGIGDDFPRGRQVDYVLGEWTNKEENDLPTHTDRAIKSIESFISIGMERTMNFHNSNK